MVEGELEISEAIASIRQPGAIVGEMSAFMIGRIRSPLRRDLPRGSTYSMTRKVSSDPTQIWGFYRKAARTAAERSDELYADLNEQFAGQKAHLAMI